MKKVIPRYGLLILLFCLILSGCSREHPDTEEEYKKMSIAEISEEADNIDFQYDNLDFSGTEIIIPDVDEMVSVNFPVSTDSLKRQIEKFEANIRKLKGLDGSADLTPYLKIAYWDYDANDRIFIPLEEATEEQLDGIQYLSYNDGTCSELIVFSNFMCEIGNYEIPTSLTGDTTDYSDDVNGYRAYDLGELEEVYQIPEDDISGVSYPLMDGEVSLQEAVEYTEQHIKEDYYFVGSDLLDYRVWRVEVRQIAEDIYYYQFDIQAVYHDVPINKDGGVGIEAEDEMTEDPLALMPFGTDHLASMFRKGHIDFIWSSCHSYESEEVQDIHTDLLPLETACGILSGYISDKQVTEIESVELLYQTKFRYESAEKRQYGYIQEICCQPAYHFVVANPGLMGYDALYFDVDAVTGVISTMAN